LLKEILEFVPFSLFFMSQSPWDEQAVLPHSVSPQPYNHTLPCPRSKATASTDHRLEPLKIHAVITFVPYQFINSGILLQ
jgi:hypothetical protein